MKCDSPLSTSSSLVEVEFGVEVVDEDEVEVGVGVEVGVEVGGVGVRVGLTCSHVYYFHGWLGGGWWCGEVKNRANLSQVRLKLRLSLAIF